MTRKVDTQEVVESWFKDARLAESDHYVAILDRYPVNRGHALIVARRDVVDMLGLRPDEFADLHRIIHAVAELLRSEYHAIGFNIGANCGQVAGQTVMRFHLHVIPRYDGDVTNPRGGIRNFKTPLVKY